MRARQLAAPAAVGLLAACGSDSTAGSNPSSPAASSVPSTLMSTETLATPETPLPTTLPPVPIATGDSGPVATDPVTPWSLPPKGGFFDYQLGGDYPPADGVVVVTRDWFAGAPAPGLYNICYINAFQTQPPDDDARPDERAGWPAAVVSSFEDPDWPGEYVIDLSTPALRTTAAAFVGTMIDTCTQKGFDAVEFDNLDSYTRFDDLPFGQSEALDYATTVTAAAHAKNLAVAQKNTAELTKEQALDQVGFDFAVVEECAEYDECAAYRAIYGLRVLSIEYSTDGMQQACAQFGAPVPVVRRDRDLVTPDEPSYEFETFCGFRGYG